MFVMIKFDTDFLKQILFFSCLFRQNSIIPELKQFPIMSSEIIITNDSYVINFMTFLILKFKNISISSNKIYSIYDMGIASHNYNEY